MAGNPGCSPAPGIGLCFGLATGLVLAAEPVLQVAPSGAIHGLAWPNRPPVSLVLLIPKPGWEGQLFAQDRWDGEHCEAAPDGRSWRITGEVSWEGGGLSLEQTVTRDGDALQVSYLLRCRGETRTEGLRLLLDSPTETLAGQGQFLLGFGDLALATQLPRELPAAYHLTHGTRPGWLAWQSGEGLSVLKPEGGWLGEVSLQDNRKFNGQAFEAQLVVADTATLRDGQEIRLALRLGPDDAAALAARGVRRLESQTVWDTARVALESASESGLGPITWSAREGPQWQPVELRFGLTGAWDNPFDPAQVDVRAEITGPDGVMQTQPAFLYQDFAPVAVPAMEVLTPRGSPEWRVRWTPLEEGRHAVRLEVTLGGRDLAADAGEFVCQGQSGHGFVRRRADTPYYLGFDDGTPYIAIGENIGWDGQTPVATYRKWFGKLHQAGGNYCRIWLVRWNLGLEWTTEDSSRRGCFYGLGRYSLDNAWRLDQVLQAAADNGIYVMLCLGYHGELLDQKAYFGEDCWRFSPYNAANGGPGAKPADFWSDETARALYRRRLRYILARWGALPNVLSWEFWNEVNAPAAWIAEMARFLADHDRHRHLRTTTYGGDDTWTQDLMDYSQAHHYGSDGTLADSGPALAATALEWTGKYRKPFQMGEFGIDWKSSDRRHDANAVGTNLHNGLWASLAPRSLGTAAIWYWDDYIDGRNLYGHFTPIAEFAKRVRWQGFAPERPARLALAYITPPPLTFADAEARPADEWRRQPEGEVRIGPDGDWLGASPSVFLFSQGKPELCSPLRLRLDLPQAGKLRLTVGKVSASATLAAKLDGQTVLTREFTCGPAGQGRYKETAWYEQWGIWQSVFDEEVAFDAPAGSHLLEVTNDSGDWLTVTRILLPGYRSSATPNVRALLLVAPRQAIGWLQDKASTWQADRDGTTLAEVAPLRLAFTGLSDGPCTVTWFDTWKGTVLREAQATVAAGALTLETPTFRRDVGLAVLAGD